MKVVIDIPDELIEASDISIEGISGVWRPGPYCTDILGTGFDGGDVKLFDVRGYGYFTGRGHGALALTNSEAGRFMSANAKVAALSTNLIRLAIARKRYSERTS